MSVPMETRRINVTLYGKTAMGSPEYHLSLIEGKWTGEKIAYGEWADIYEEELANVLAIVRKALGGSDDGKATA